MALIEGILLNWSCLGTLVPLLRVPGRDFYYFWFAGRGFGSSFEFRVFLVGDQQGSRGAARLP